MIFEEQLTSLELSKRLNQLVVKQESLFYWEWVNDNCYAVRYFPFCVTPKNQNGVFHYSAFTMAEMMHLLPMHITIKGEEPFDNYRLQITSSVIVKNPEHIDPIRTTIVNYKCDSINLTDKQTVLEAALGKYLTKNIWDENTSNALAKMLIYLVENDLMVVVQ